LPFAVLAKEPASLSAEDALTVGWALAPVAVQVSTSTGPDAPTQAAGIGTMELLGMWMPAHFMQNTRTPTDDRNLALCPLFMELLKAPEELPDFGLVGVLFALEQGAIARPAVATKLLELDAIAVLMAVLRQASPTELVATAGFSRRPHGFAVLTLRQLIETAQTAGADLTTLLLTSGFIDTLISALCAVEKVGADGVNGCMVAWGILAVLTVLDGEALPQIEDKLRAIPSALRYAKDSKLAHMADFGVTAGTYATIVAGESLALCFALLCRVAGSNTYDDCSLSLGERRGQPFQNCP
jgi:hypothetical protein